MANTSKKNSEAQTAIETKSVKKETSDTISPEIMDKIPGPMREQILESMSVFSGPMPHPLASKITPEHIEKMIDQSANETQLTYSFKSNGRWFTLVYVSIAIVAFFVFAFMFAKDDPELFKNILSHFGVAIAGCAAGWGLKVNKSDTE